MRPGTRFEWAVDGVDVPYAADEEGFRTGASAEGGAPPGRRIVIVGDSYPWGFGVPYEQSCGALLEERLDGPAVLNRAMVGFGLDQVWLALRHWALPLEPDLVVVGVFIDDFNRSFHAYRRTEGFNKPVFRRSGDELIQQTEADRPGRWLRFLESRSRVFTLLRQGDRWLGRHLGVGGWWYLNEAFLDAIRRDADAASTPVLFVHIPYPEPIAFAALDGYMEEHRAHFLKLAERPADQRRAFFFERDVHLNAAGHVALADALEGWIRAEMPELAEGGGAER